MCFFWNDLFVGYMLCLQIPSSPKFSVLFCNTPSVCICLDHNALSVCKCSVCFALYVYMFFVCISCSVCQILIICISLSVICFVCNARLSAWPVCNAMYFFICSFCNSLTVCISSICISVCLHVLYQQLLYLPVNLRPTCNSLPVFWMSLFCYFLPICTYFICIYLFACMCYVCNSWFVCICFICTYLSVCMFLATILCLYACTLSSFPFCLCSFCLHVLCLQYSVCLFVSCLEASVYNAAGSRQVEVNSLPLRRSAQPLLCVHLADINLSTTA
jgi:hypothetical protein